MTSLDFKTIGLKIRERRLIVNVTQEYIANKLDVNPSHISNIERGHSHPSLTKLVNIANILECSVDYFIGGEYTYNSINEETRTLDDKIMNKLKYYDTETKLKFLKVMDLL